MPGLFGYVGFSKKKDGDILKNTGPSSWSHRSGFSRFVSER